MSDRTNNATPPPAQIDFISTRNRVKPGTDTSESRTLLLSHVSFSVIIVVTDVDATSAYLAQSEIDTSAEFSPSNGDNDGASDDIGEGRDDGAADSAAIDGDELIDGADDDDDDDDDDHENDDAAVFVTGRAISADCFAGHTGVDSSVHLMYNTFSNFARHFSTAS
nr:unnamed protein product [Fasciola hepatica]CAK6928330.1 unnamed protein product [Fasciola hepatica]CAK6928335.1 unnamed protein product [Fasciola hepatica]